MIGLQNLPNIIPPNPDFLYGRIKDNPGDGSGTPLNQLTNGDIQEFFAKLMGLAGITPNGLPDCEYTGHQSITSLWKFGNNNFISDIIIGLLGGYTANDVIVLWGATVTTGGTSSISAGAIFYNDNLYKVVGNSVSGSSGLVYNIDTSEDCNQIVLANTGSGTGIADYGAITVHNLLSWISGTEAGANSPKFPVYQNSFGNVPGSPVVKFIKNSWGRVEIMGACARSTDISGPQVLFTLPSGYFDPSTNSYYPIMVQPATGGAVASALLGILSNGDAEVIYSSNCASVFLGSIFYYV